MVRGLREVTFTMRIHDRRSDRIIVESVSFTALEIDRYGGDVGALLSLVGHRVRSLRRVLRHHWRVTVLGPNYPARLRAARLKRYAMAGWDKHRAPLLAPWEVERERARFAAELEFPAGPGRAARGWVGRSYLDLSQHDGDTVDFETWSLQHES
jgi:hypothetical protein